jgi:hypothetical protein
MKSIHFTLSILCLLLFVTSTEAQFFKGKSQDIPLLTSNQRSIGTTFWQIEIAQLAVNQATTASSRLLCPVSIDHWVENSSLTADSLFDTYNLHPALLKNRVVRRMDLSPTVTLLRFN